MAELTRGTIFDRPWGRTLAALGLRGVTGQLTLTAFDGKMYEIAFANGAVVGASSPIASDAAVRVALTGGLISTTQVAELARKQAAESDRDEIDVISDHLRLAFDQAMRLRRRTIAQRAARSFSVDKGDFIVDDQITLPSVAGSELDVRAIIYLGARQNLSEARLAAELGLFGTWFRIKPEAFEDLPQFGFTHEERPIIDALMNGVSLGELESIVGIDGRMVRATLYTLCAANACNVEQTRGHATKPPPTTMRTTDPNLRRSGGSQPPPSQPAPAPPVPAAAPREKRQTAQPLVAYRPGLRRGGTSPPTNVTHTPVEANRPVGAAGNTMPPANARRAATTPPAGNDIYSRAQSEPPPDTGNARYPRAQSEPGAPAETGNARYSRAKTDPGVARTGTGSNPGIARTGSGSNPGVARTGTASNPGATRTTPPLTMPRTATRTPTPVPSRTTTPTSVPRTATPAPSARKPTLRNIRAGSTTKLPGLQVPEVQTLIAARAAQMDQGADHYALLGVAQNASPDEIRKVYFDYARQLHPDRLAALGISDDAHVAHKVFAQLNTAFSTLSDSRRRADYDQLLGRGGEAAQREDQAKAEEMALRILSAEESYKKGELALKRQDLATAVAELSRACELNPDEPDFSALHAWAVFCAASDKNRVARQTRATLEKAVQHSPKAISPRFYLARVHRMLGNDREALEMFKDVLVDKPSHAEAQAEVRAIEARLQGPKPSGGGLFGKKR